MGGVFILCFVLFAAVSDVYGVKFPSDFMRCSLKDPELSKCIQIAEKDAVEKLRNGRKSLGIPVLDPLHVNSITVGENTGSPVAITQTYKDIEMHGVLDYTVTNFNMDADKDTIIVETMSPNIQILSDYEMKGRILLLPIQGLGRSNLTLVNLKTKSTLIGKRTEKNGKLYWIMQDYLLRYDPQRLYMNFTNLFNGDERLGKTMNEFLNENWAIIFEEVGRSFEKSYGEAFRQVANQIFANIPMKDIFLDVD